MSDLLAVSGIVKTFGGVVALNGVSLSVERGQLVGLIGPNGSGKTTLLNVVSGFYTPDSGTIRYQGRAIARHEPAELARSGIARSFQVTKTFRRLTVLENLLVPGLLGWSVTARAATESALRILADLHLDGLAHQRASHLSGGQAKLLEFGRLMMLEPTLVLLDEPFAGVHPELKGFMHERIRAWSGRGVTIVLVSHDMGSIFGLCRRVVALHNGTLIADGEPERVRRDERVLESYLGEHRFHAGQ